MTELQDAKISMDDLASSLFHTQIWISSPSEYVRVDSLLVCLFKC